jgi:hypothetical protein
LFRILLFGMLWILGMTSCVTNMCRRRMFTIILRKKMQSFILECNFFTL